VKETFKMAKLAIEPTGEKSMGECQCCGNKSRRVWGLVRKSQHALASYFVHWTVGRIIEHGAHFDLVLGKWGDHTSPADRYLVSLEYRVLKSGPAFMVIDAAGRPADDPQLVSRALTRTEVIGTPIAKQAFEIVDALLAKDLRLAELSN
jgi:hypothetical protein